MGLQPFKQLKLGLCHPVERTEKLKVFPPYVGDEPMSRLQNRAKVFDLAGVIGTNFDNGYFVSTLQPEKGERNSDLVVQIPFGCQHFELLP